jgi:hypothetical protein
MNKNHNRFKEFLAVRLATRICNPRVGWFDLVAMFDVLCFYHPCLSLTAGARESVFVDEVERTVEPSTLTLPAAGGGGS